MDMSIGELVSKIRAARQRMSWKNPHRALFGLCEDALIQLARRAVGEPSTKDAPHAQTDTDTLGR